MLVGGEREGGHGGWVQELIMTYVLPWLLMAILH